MGYILIFVNVIVKVSLGEFRNKFLFFVTYRRKDREPSKYSRVCSCYFRDENKSYGPEIYTRNQEKIFPAEGGPPKKKKKVTTKKKTLHEMVETIRGEQQSPDEDSQQEAESNNKGNNTGGRVQSNQGGTEEHARKRKLQTKTLYSFRT